MSPNNSAAKSSTGNDNVKKRPSTRDSTTLGRGDSKNPNLSVTNSSPRTLQASPSNCDGGDDVESNPSRGRGDIPFEIDVSSSIAQPAMLGEGEDTGVERATGGAEGVEEESPSVYSDESSESGVVRWNGVSLSVFNYRGEKLFDERGVDNTARLLHCQIDRLCPIYDKLGDTNSFWLENLSPGLQDMQGNPVLKVHIKKQPEGSQEQSWNPELMPLTCLSRYDTLRIKCSKTLKISVFIEGRWETCCVVMRAIIVGLLLIQNKSNVSVPEGRRSKIVTTDGTQYRVEKTEDEEGMTDVGRKHLPVDSQGLPRWLVYSHSSKHNKYNLLKDYVKNGKEEEAEHVSDCD